MTWLTWRQFRAQAVTAAVALAAFAILLAATGPSLASRFAGSRITGCHGASAGGGCNSAAISFLNRLAATTLYPAVYAVGLVVIIVAPVIIGIFWGAPLIARELETRTFALAWTQSITRARWLTVKLALTGLAAMAVTEALSLMYAWWAEPIGRAISLGASTSVFTGGRFSPLIFATRGITPLGYAAFAFALGAAAGALIRRTLPAMAVTLAIFAAVQIAMPLWIRPYLIPPRHTTATFASVQAVDIGTLAATVVPGHPGAWILSSGAVDAAGQPVNLGAVSASCFSQAPSGIKEGPSAPAMWQCLERRHIQATVTYQPGSRYWPLQGIETGIFLALAVSLAGFFCFWRLGRRRT
jgi:ABC-type transport system involved in multi-copper enzyme maturation permease subunit